MTHSITMPFNNSVKHSVRFPESGVTAPSMYRIWNGYMMLATAIRKFHITAIRCIQPKLTPQEVSEILRKNEFSKEFLDGPVKSYDSNQLASNDPMEDSRAEAKSVQTGGLLIGIFDGHAGAACAQVIAKRIFKYICVNVLPNNLLRQYLIFLEGDDKDSIRLLEKYNDKYELVAELKSFYKQSLIEYIKEVIASRDSNDQRLYMEEAMEKGLLRLDKDISEEAIKTNGGGDGKNNMQTLSVAFSGAVACVAHIDESHLHVANVGDCQAVLGVQTEDNAWSVKRLTTCHNADNVCEVARILSQHPASEKDTVIRSERLLGQLAPLRAFGDVRYKWSLDLVDRVLVPYFGREVVSPGYHTPPYLTAQPEITYHHLTPRDKFMIVASDGLWDFMSPLEAVKLVGEHMCGKVALSPFKLPKMGMKLKEIHALLSQRRRSLNMKPADVNAATHLFRNTLGGTEYGVEHCKLSNMLTLPQEVVRLFRDDITVTVVYFNSDYFRKARR